MTETPTEVVVLIEDCQISYAGAEMLSKKMAMFISGLKQATIVQHTQSKLKLKLELFDHAPDIRCFIKEVMRKIELYIGHNGGPAFNVVTTYNHD